MQYPPLPPDRRARRRAASVWRTSHREHAMTQTVFGKPGACSCQPLVGRSREQQDPQTVGVIHDLGNLVQVAASAVSLMARGPGDREVSEIEPLIAGAKSALERAGVLARQAIGGAQTGARVL